MTQDKLSLDKRTVYRIKVPGDAIQYRNGWDRIESAFVEQDPHGNYTTTFICNCDQAGLHGLLRSLYSRGLPLLSVSCEEIE